MKFVRFQEKNRNRFLKPLSTILLAVFIQGCGVENNDTGISNSDANSKVVTIGLIAPLSGEIADLGKEILNSSKIAVEMFNEKSDTLTVKISSYDDSMSSTTASTAVANLIREGAVGIIGASTSSIVKSEITALSDTKIPIITPTATSTGITEGVDYAFRVIPSNQFQANALADEARKRNIKSMVILFQKKDDYGEDLAKAFKASFEKEGGKIETEIAFSKDEKDFRIQLSQIEKLNVGGILCAAQHVKASEILVRAGELKVNLPIFAGETAFTEKLLNAAGKQASDLDFFVAGSATDFQNPSPILKSFMDKYASIHQGALPGSYGSYAFDATSIMMESVSKGQYDSESLVSDLKSIQDFEGVTGPITFDQNGDNITDYQIYTVTDNTFVPVNDQ